MATTQVDFSVMGGVRVMIRVSDDLSLDRTNRDRATIAADRAATAVQDYYREESND